MKGKRFRLKESQTSRRTDGKNAEFKVKRFFGRGQVRVIGSLKTSFEIANGFMCGAGAFGEYFLEKL